MANTTLPMNSRQSMLTLQSFKLSSLNWQKKHLRPLASSTLKKYDRARCLWLTYFEWLYASPEKAHATLAEDAELPPTQELKMLVGNLAKKGCSGLRMSLTGWSYHTARDFVRSIEGMVSASSLFSLFFSRSHVESSEKAPFYTTGIKG